MDPKKNLHELINGIRPFTRVDGVVGIGEVTALIDYCDSDLVDALADMIDEGIRTARYSTHEEWREAVRRTLGGQ